MLISFDQYLSNYCLVPIACTCFCVLVLVCELRHVLGYIRLCDFSLKNIFSTVFCSVISIILLIQVGIVPLCNGGFFLLFENESGAVRITGSINSIDTVGYNLYARSEAYCFKIDGTECVGIYVNADDVPLSTGDYVDALYLPQSGYILSIDKIDSPY